MKKIYFILVILSVYSAQSQIGYKTVKPTVTLDIGSAPNDPTISDGIIGPRLTMDQLLSKTYGQDQTGAIVYITDITTSIAPLPNSVVNILAVGYYFFNGTQWKTLRSRPGTVSFSASLQNGYSYVMPGDSYNTIRFSTNTNIGGGIVDTNNYTYTIPITGEYLVSASLRIYDSVRPSRNIYISVGTMLTDDGNGAWTYNSEVPGYRFSVAYSTILKFNKGDVIQQFAYSEGSTLGLAYAYWAVTLLHQSDN